MNAIRTFIAIEIPPNVQETLGKVIDQLRQEIGNSVRWVPASNIHLTLKFLGNVSPTNLDLLTRVLHVEIARHKIFEFEIGNLGVFPNPKRPRVVWVEIQAPDTLKTLQAGIEQETQRLGYPSEERAFSPHLTLGRVGHNAMSQDFEKIQQALDKIKAEKLGTVVVDSVKLYRSDLVQNQRIYTPIFTVRLKSQ